MLPEQFLERMRCMLGEEYDIFLETFGQERRQALRLNPLKYDAEGRSAAQRYGTDSGSFAVLEKVPWAEDGYYYRGQDQPGKHPFHEAGLYYIQEPSAMAPVELMEVQPGERVLDMCAAPGGKSTQIAAKLKGRGLLVCNEIHPARAKILSENIERMGIGNACVINEAPERLVGLFSGFFDKVLVDAPCSGEGMFRKNQEACGEWSPENVRLCAQRQDGILDCAARMLKPGGRLVYSTCTFSLRENEGSVSRFLERNEDFQLMAIDKGRLGLEGCDGITAYFDEEKFLWGDAAGKVQDIEGNGSWAHMPGMENTLRLWPHRIRGEGHYAAVLRKKGNLPEICGNNDRIFTVERNAEAAWKEFCAFCRENLTCRIDLSRKTGESPGMEGAARYIVFGDNLYVLPEEMPSLKGLKVVRPGLHLGTLKKNRFQPSHALALALRPGSAARRWEFSDCSPDLVTYLGGGTFSGEGEKGWYLVCVEGFGIGWGKLAGGVMKNHYPKGLRKG